MGKGNGSTRASSSANSNGLSSASQNNREPIRDGYYQLDGRTIRVVSNDTLKQYSSMSKADLRDEARRLYRVNAYDNTTSKADYLGDILAAKFGRNFIAERDLTADEKRRLVRR